MLRPLILNPDVIKRVAEQRDWCNRRENWFDPAKNKDAPGDDPAFVLMLELGFRVVYTVTFLDGIPFRHLSVSVEGGDGKYPDPISVFTIATMFGFTGGHRPVNAAPNGFADVTCGPGKDWQWAVDEARRAMVLGQVLESEGIASGADNKH